MAASEPSGRVIEYAVLCGPEDEPALWAATQLRRRGLDLRVVTTEELVYSPSLTHTVSGSGTGVEVRLLDGSVLGPGLRGTVNRVSRLPVAHLAATPEVDRDYVLAELQAVLTSLLHALEGVVLGRPSARGLSGTWWRPAEWMVEAGQAGLVSVGYRSGGADPLPPNAIRSVLVIGSSVVGPGADAMPEPVREGCLRLARRHGSGLVGLHFVVTDGQWLFAAGDPAPDLRLGGPAAVEAMLTAFATAAALLVPA